MTKQLPQVFVHNRQRKIAVDGAALEKFAREILPACADAAVRGLTNCLRDLEEINVLLFSDKRIAQLHQQFMAIPGPTDVITFQHGEICISVQTARRQAKRARTSLTHELRLYLVHGLLHLVGHDDRTAAGRARMEKLQEKILAGSGGL